MSCGSDRLDLGKMIQHSGDAFRKQALDFRMQ
jgi:hypothetical protein